MAYECPRRDFVLASVAFAAMGAYAHAPDGRAFDAKAAWESFVKAYWIPKRAQF